MGLSLGVGRLTLGANRPKLGGPLRISGSPPEATAATPYAWSPSAAGGKRPYTFAIVGTLPAGLTFNTSTGAITGTPTGA